jgi:protein phosphatase
VGKSDVGVKRSANEDTFVVRPELGLFVVADGMGGAAAGEVASQIFAETALEIFSNAGTPSKAGAVDLVETTFARANERILRHATENPDSKGMGCTAELVTFLDESFILGHVGDSRTYLFREERLRQLTEDHTVVQHQLDQGAITTAEARNHPSRHIILRAVGVAEQLALDVVEGRVVSGDLVLLCSDGITDMVDDGVIHEILASQTRMTEKIEELIILANSAGGKDNVTVVLCEVE